MGEGTSSIWLHKDIPVLQLGFEKDRVLMKKGHFRMRKTIVGLDLKWRKCPKVLFEKSEVEGSVQNNIFIIKAFLKIQTHLW